MMLPTRTDPPSRRRSRPDLPVVAALAVLGVVCTGLWWSGAVAPRVTAVVRSIDASGTGGTIAIDVANQGPLAVEVRQVRVSVSGGAPVEIVAERLDRQNLRSPARLTAGQSARIEVDYAFDCRGPSAIGADAAVLVRVSGALGATRTRQASTLEVERERSGGRDFRDLGPLLCPMATPHSVPAIAGGGG
jgi:hypothetical protein